MSISNLPSVYLDDMKKILGNEYEAFLDSYSRSCRKALRINTLKLKASAAGSDETAETDAGFIRSFETETGFHLTPVPWTSNGFYYEKEDQPSRHPFYSAGLYYLQEASAMAPAQMLPVSPGDRVLDLCAAPGGKATELGARLRGRGFLAANEISMSRARILMKNLELFGILNACVTNTEPARLLERYPAFFNRILVDAPCSGEGMFRKDPAVAEAWYPEKVQECARVQREIITCAADMLRPGGMMLYSTCTFAPQENELIILHLLQERPEMELLEVPYEPFRKYFSEGLSTEQLRALGYLDDSAKDVPDTDLSRTCRLWPHKIEGEGHFCALLRKRESEEMREALREAQPENIRRAYEAERPGRNGKTGRKSQAGKSGRPGETGKTRRSGETSRTAGQETLQRSDLLMIQNFIAAYLEQPQSGELSVSDTDILTDVFLEGRKEGKIEAHGGQVYLMPAGVEREQGVPTLRAGLYLGELKKNRFEPAQELAMALPAAHFPGESVQAENPDEEDQAAVQLEDVSDRYVCLSPSDDRLERYLRGEVIPVRQTGSNGWRLLCAGRYPIGWGKLVGDQLKNKYPAGWRIPG